MIHLEPIHGVASSALNDSQRVPGFTPNSKAMPITNSEMMKRLELDSTVNIDELYGKTFDEDDKDELSSSRRSIRQSQNTDLVRITWE